MPAKDETICNKDAAYRYTWPGRNEAYICEEHSNMLRAVAGATGLPLQLIPVDPQSACCEQKVSR